MRKPLACGMALCALLVAACGSSTRSTSGQPSVAQGVAFADCIRSHGVADFPDPISGHAFQFPDTPGLNPASPAFRAAQKACRSLGPSPPAGRGGVSSSEQASDLAHADCMRSHGVPDYPDPTYSNGRPTEEPLSKYGVNEHSPAFLNAAKACGGE